MRIGSDKRSPFSDKRLTLYAALSVSALLGALFGALCWCSGVGSEQLSGMLDNAQKSFFEVRRSGDIPALLLGTLSGTGFYLLAAFLLGFSALAQPFELILPFLRGMTCGVMMTVSCGGVFDKSSLMKTFAVFPGVLAALVITVLASREAVLLSDRLFGICFSRGLTEGLRDRIRLYVVRFIGLLAAVSVTAFIDLLLAMLLL